MKSGRKLEKNSLSVMSQLFDKGAMIVNDFITMGYEYDNRFIYRAMYNNLYNLKRRGYVRVKKQKNQSFFHLTPKGRLSVLKYLHLEKLIKKWDKHWRIIIFDIPESLKKWREHIRRELKQLGFVALQESVYITPYPITGELDKFLEEWNLRKYFRYITVMEIDDEDKLKKKFNLK